MAPSALSVLCLCTGGIYVLYLRFTCLPHALPHKSLPVLAGPSNTSLQVFGDDMKEKDEAGKYRAKQPGFPFQQSRQCVKRQCVKRGKGKYCTNMAAVPILFQFQL
jgi:hypothetical protein